MREIIKNNSTQEKALSYKKLLFDSTKNKFKKQDLLEV